MAAVSAAEAVGEIMPYVASGVGSQQRLDALLSKSFEPASSKWSRDLYLDDCIEVPRTFVARAQPASVRKRMLGICLQTAQRLTQATPASSKAWLVVATTSAELGDLVTMRSALVMSKRTAPNIQWYADRRSRLYEANPSELDATTRGDYESDLAVLAAGEEGIKVLAQRYARRPELRDTYIRIVETASPGQKQAFLNRVKVELAS